LRIISGKYKGSYFTPPKNTFKARPTTDYAKESLFNILNNSFDFAGLHVLDLFAGTGSISYEFASRGCEKIISVENDFSHFNYIKKTVEKLGINIKTVKADVFSYLPKLTETFDIIFADPPFNLQNTEQLPDLIFKYHLLNENGWFILEHDKHKSFSKHPNFFDFRKYGSVCFSFFRL